MNAVISEEYKNLNTQLHEEREDYGVGGHQFKDMVAQICSSTGSSTVLDYGCGKATLANALPHMDIRSYDPAIEELSEPPAPAEVVVCTDVLEHVEPELLDNVLDDLQRLAQKVLFVTVACRPAQKFLADGRNAHLIVEKPEWWLEKMMKRWRIDTYNRMGNEDNPEAMFMASFSSREWTP